MVYVGLELDGESATPKSWVDDTPARIIVTLNEDGRQAEWRCSRCWETLTENSLGALGDDVDGSTTCDPSYSEEHDEETDDPILLPHKAERIPLTWCKSAGVVLNEHDDSVSVKITTGDPRGGFFFTVYRTVGEDGTERLTLHTPYPGEPMPHQTLTEMRPGVYLIGG